MILGKAPDDGQSNATNNDEKKGDSDDEAKISLHIDNEEPSTPNSDDEAEGMFTNEVMEAVGKEMLDGEGD
jgi:hypothetical protein